MLGDLSVTSQALKPGRAFCNCCRWRLLHRPKAESRVSQQCAAWQVTEATLAGFGEPNIYGMDSSHTGIFQTADECCAKCRNNSQVPDHPAGTHTCCSASYLGQE